MTARGPAQTRVSVPTVVQISGTGSKSLHRVTWPPHGGTRRPHRGMRRHTPRDATSAPRDATSAPWDAPSHTAGRDARTAGRDVTHRGTRRPHRGTRRHTPWDATPAPRDATSHTVGRDVRTVGRDVPHRVTRRLAVRYGPFSPPPLPPAAQLSLNLTASEEVDRTFLSNMARTLRRTDIFSTQLGQLWSVPHCLCRPSSTCDAGESECGTDTLVCAGGRRR
jgi:hypothetical protein